MAQEENVSAPAEPVTTSGLESVRAHTAELLEVDSTRVALQEVKDLLEKGPTLERTDVIKALHVLATAVDSETKKGPLLPKVENIVSEVAEPEPQTQNNPASVEAVVSDPSDALLKTLSSNPQTGSPAVAEGIPAASVVPEVLPINVIPGAQASPDAGGMQGAASMTNTAEPTDGTSLLTGGVTQQVTF